MSDALATYLYDQLCGATIAIEVLHALSERYKGMPLETFVASVRTEAEAERQLLLLMSGTLGIASNSDRGQRWLTDRAALIKHGIVTEGHLGKTIAMQYLAMITGARVSLWKMLETAAAPDGRLVAW